MLLAEIISVSNSTELHVIDIENIDRNLENSINELLVSICEGDSLSELPNVKTRLLDYLSTKSEYTQQGSIAEFFVHLYMNLSGFKQEFLYFNLEEGSIKKGFDGFFTKNNESYLLESKSGSIKSIGCSHKSKLTEAYTDLKTYVSGQNKKGKNNPWRNAYNHASHCDVGTTRSIRKKIKDLSDMFDKKDFKDISEFHIVPCSTIFLDGTWDIKSSSEIMCNYDFLNNFSGKSITAISVSKRSIDTFFDYLRG
ncbi:hypothetical protein [Enterovibrio norvegicus]|uniref:hypothetical protein n=1 Tax=Enterovibrio norvegicus TaxID=188144 RepID=UPI0010BE8660|nr:hypothetical protein [Enterovibrio norvegicus]TKF32243.1 hypothetical protein FCV83_14010 [Enterovibrio norvegicus]